LGLFHRDSLFPLKPEKATQEAKLSGVVQMLAVEELPPNN
jgi:hypothetical protein